MLAYHAEYRQRKQFIAHLSPHGHHQRPTKLPHDDQVPNPSKIYRIQIQPIKRLFSPLFRNLRCRFQHDRIRPTASLLPPSGWCQTKMLSLRNFLKRWIWLIIPLNLTNPMEQAESTFGDESMESELLTQLVGCVIVERATGKMVLEIKDPRMYTVANFEDILKNTTNN